MNWEQKERVVREKRTIEATKKNLMGPAGKLGVIVRSLGNPIIRQGTGLFDADFLEDPYDDFTDEVFETTVSGQDGPLVNRDEIQELSDDFIQHEGYIFDGLSRGMHMEIQYHSVNHKLTVTYKGYLVYKEVAGELESFAPQEEWEMLIEKLYTVAKKQEKVLKKQRDLEITEKVQERKTTFWNRMKQRWGL